MLIAKLEQVLDEDTFYDLIEFIDECNDYVNVIYNILEAKDLKEYTYTDIEIKKIIINLKELFNKA